MAVKPIILNDNNLRFIQKIIWDESKYIIKEAIKFKEFDKFKNYIIETLPQTSVSTRKRYTN